MAPPRCRPAPWALGPTFVALALTGCFQSDQKLPFELGDDTAVSRSIGAQGGVISLSSGVSLSIPAGALAAQTQITLSPLPDGAFPGDAGEVVPGTVFDVAPAGLLLSVPAEVTLRLPSGDIAAETQVRLGVAVASGGRSDLAAVGSFDATSRLLRGSVRTLGPVAAVVAEDAIPVGSGAPPALGGGTFASGASGSPARAGAADQAFASSCSPEARRCFSSGLVQVWVSPELLDRLGGSLAILAPRLSADFTFGGLDAAGLPTTTAGSLSIRGTLRAGLGQGVSSYEVDETFVTGSGGGAATTGVHVSGNRMVLAETSDGGSRTLEYDLRPIGTGRLLTLRVEDEVELENDDGSVTKGTVILHVRLRG